MNEMIHVVPILIVGFIGLVVSIERFYALVISYPLQHSTAFFERVRHLVMNDELEKATELCFRYRAQPAAQVIWQALLPANQPEQVIQQGIGVAVSQMIQKVKKRTGFIATAAGKCIYVARIVRHDSRVGAIL